MKLSAKGRTVIKKEKVGDYLVVLTRQDFKVIKKIRWFILFRSTAANGTYSLTGSKDGYLTLEDGQDAFQKVICHLTGIIQGLGRVVR